MALDSELLRTVMSLSAWAVTVAMSCGPSQPPALGSTAAPAARAAPPSASALAGVAPRGKVATKKRYASDTPLQTSTGAAFIVPAGWSALVDGPVILVEAPEGDSRLALIDVPASDADAAVAAAWATYGPGNQRATKATSRLADKDGWRERRQYVYQTSPNERREVFARAMSHGSSWLVVISDCTEATAEKRLSQVELILGQLVPPGYQRESFADRKANVLDAARLQQLTAFIERAQSALGVPGVSLGLIQNGEAVFQGGFGVRQLARDGRVDADTLFLIASNTKALTTLMLAKLVDDQKLTWETPVTSVLPEFRLGDPATTASVRVKHLVCAYTGLPRQDYEWLLEFKSSTARSTLALLGTVAPTSKFGEMYQYSNLLAAAAGFVGGHVLFPKVELGAAYDRAMTTLVFNPLGMRSTTFDFQRALQQRHAVGHGLSIDDRLELALMAINYSTVPLRPSGGAWSNARDMLKFVAMELAGGTLPDGKRYISEAALLARRSPQVAMSKDETYGMGLRVDNTYAVPVVHHTGSVVGYKSGMMWLPQQGVGAVLLTNSDSGRPLVPIFRRKLLEVLFDGKPEADTELEAQAAAMHQQIAAERRTLTVPAEEELAARLAPVYTSPALGELRVQRASVPSGASLIFDFGEWQSPVASRRNADGTVSFITIATGVALITELTIGSEAGKRTLVARDAQHEYVFVER